MAGFTPPPVTPSEPPAVPEPVPDVTLDETATESTDQGISELPSTSESAGGLSVSAPTKDETAAAEPATGAPAPASDASSGATPSSNDLLRIKQDALQQLSPLVSHLDQTPEERFRTTMMMIQATDDSSMIGSAYEAAQEITDEKVRAQALLDVVNEINYFSQQQNQDQ